MNLIVAFRNFANARNDFRVAELLMSNFYQPSHSGCCVKGVGKEKLFFFAKGFLFCCLIVCLFMSVLFNELST